MNIKTGIWLKLPQLMRLRLLNAAMIEQRNERSK